MTTIDNGGPAFPVGSGDMRDPVGMTLRDYFAAKAMQAQIGNPLNLGSDEAHRLVAERAYRLADVMIKARKPTP